MRFTFAATIVFAAALILVVSFNISNYVSAQTDCVQALTAETTEGAWTDECQSRNRENTYARSYTFNLTAESEVTITLESDTDPYLYLLDDSDAIVEENDDIDYNGRNYNSQITRTLAPATTPSKPPLTLRIQPVILPLLSRESTSTAHSHHSPHRTEPQTPLPHPRSLRASSRFPTL